MNFLRKLRWLNPWWHEKRYQDALSCLIEQSQITSSLSEENKNLSRALNNQTGLYIRAFNELTTHLEFNWNRDEYSTPRLSLQGIEDTTIRNIIFGAIERNSRIKK